jgi:hypothetical protein
MAFEYSSFISYRHNDLDHAYFENLKNFLKSEVFSATNIQEIFYDKVSIKWGVTWDDKIYSGIEGSFFFLPIWYYHYLNEDNLWCARELYHALEIEKIIRSQLTPADQDDFVFIFPLVYKGSVDLIPSCLSEKNAKSLVGYEVIIKTKKINNKFQSVINNIYDTLLVQYMILEKYAHVDFQALFQQIQRPSDSVIKDWIKQQKKNIAQKEANKPPVLVKNGE